MIRRFGHLVVCWLTGHDYVRGRCLNCRRRDPWYHGVPCQHRTGVYDMTTGVSKCSTCGEAWQGGPTAVHRAARTSTR